MRTSILGTFFLASPQEIQQGANWYSNAAELASSIASELNSHPYLVAGVIAALSPNNRWERNILDARNMIQAWSIGGLSAAEDVRVCTFNLNKQKAIKLLYGQTVEDVLGGLKVMDFFRCITGDENTCCIDGHAYSIWLGERLAASSAPKIRPKLYQRIQEDYRQAKERINNILGTDYTTPQVQAITWTVHRNLYAGQRRNRKGTSK